MASITKRGNGQWRARYRDDVEKEHAKHFDRKVDAQRWLNEVTASLVTGSYVDPKAGSVTFERFYAQWSQRQVWVPSTRVNADHAAASVPFAQVPLKSLRRSHVEQWVKAMTKDLAATTIHTRVTIVRSVLRGAVADRVIPVDPSEGVTLPRRRRREAAMQVPSVEQVGRGDLHGSLASSTSWEGDTLAGVDGDDPISNGGTQNRADDGHPRVNRD